MLGDVFDRAGDFDYKTPLFSMYTAGLLNERYSVYCFSLFINFFQGYGFPN